MATGRYQSFGPNPLMPKDTFIVCDYSRATQLSCKPVEKCFGTACTCATCLCTPFVCCVLLCCNSNRNAWNDCRAILSTGNHIGACSVRSLNRIIGMVLGLACYPCEKINRLTHSAKINGNQHTLFCCNKTREELAKVDCRETPDPSICMLEDAGPKRQTMA